MATIKSNTDISQSRKIAEFLPLESADMYWDYDVLKHEDYPMVMDDQFDDLCTPAWSLTALLNVMPQINDWITPHGHKNDKPSQFEPKICKIWEHSSIPSYKVTYGNGLSTDIYDNPVDAAFEMVLKLHELGLL